MKFVGALRHASGEDKLVLNANEGVLVRTVVSEISEGRPELKRNLIDTHFQDQKLNTLILVNGREISVLNGLETRLEDRDELVFIPVVHGG